MQGIAPDLAGQQRQAIRLFLVGFLVLFLELACIRWLASYVIFLQFFTNVVLIASFLGTSCGCLAARHKREWLNYFPLIALGTIAAALAIAAAYRVWSGLTIDVGGQGSPQEVFFGTEYKNADVAQFVVPIEAIAGIFFVLVTLMFLGLGQVLGRELETSTNRVIGYALNIAGSLAGIIGFSALSLLQAPPVVWFALTCAGIAYLLRQDGNLTGPRIVAMIALVAGVALPGSYKQQETVTRWSPYYKVEHEVESRGISVNTIAHQNMVPFATGGSVYSLIHLLQKHSGGEPFRDMLVIGAGSGNDVAHSLKHGAERVDAVEIDPVIQDIGRGYHPDRPYQDQRVVPHLDDGRHFLRTTDKKYDLVVYALVDSLILHSGYANIRLESYLFTQQAFADVKRVLKPGGTFVMYNYFRQGWIVERIAAMVEATFGCRPIVLSLPYQEKLGQSALDGMTMVIGGCNPRIAKAFSENRNFFLDTVPPRNLTVDGFRLDADKVKAAPAGEWERIAPTEVPSAKNTILINDDWPFLYLQGRLIPDFTLRSIALLGVLGALIVYLFMPRGQLRIDTRMFFLGAGFMLLETRAVSQMALLFGSTWVVNSWVFATILVLILAANLYVLQSSGRNVMWTYAGLVVVLIVAALLPLDLFLTEGVVWRYVTPCVLALSPVFFAGVIFARSLKVAPAPELALGWNIAGAVVGGLTEPVVMLLGFQHLLFVALAFYLLSAWSPRPVVASSPA